MCCCPQCTWEQPNALRLLLSIWYHWPFCPLLFTEGQLLISSLVHWQLCAHTCIHSAHTDWDCKFTSESSTVCIINPVINKSLLLQVMLPIIGHQENCCYWVAFTHYPLWCYGICSSMQCTVHDLFWTLCAMLYVGERAKYFSQQGRDASWVQSSVVALAGLLCLPLSLTFSMVSPMLLTLWPPHILLPVCWWLILTSVVGSAELHKKNWEASSSNNINILSSRWVCPGSMRGAFLSSFYLLMHLCPLFW